MPRQTEAQLVMHAREQLGFLQRSGDFFDAGYRSEAKRIAVSVANLVHDRGRIQSLLTLLGRKSGLKFMDTANEIIPGTVIQEHRLCGMRIYQQGKGSGFYPFLDSPISRVRWRDFDDWWNAEIVTDNQGHSLSRADLVLSFRDSDGGAHIDAKLRKPYHALSRDNSIGLRFGNSDFEGPAEYGPEYASVRQIGFEAYMSICIAIGNEIGWETPDIEIESAPLKLSGMPIGEVDGEGERAVFSLAFENGETLSFSCATDAIEGLLRNFEIMARKAYLRQMDNGLARSEPPEELPVFHTHCSRIEIQDSDDNPGYMLLVIRRGARPPVQIVISRELAEHIRDMVDRKDNA